MDVVSADEQLFIVVEFVFKSPFLALRHTERHWFVEHGSVIAHLAAISALSHLIGVLLGCLIVFRVDFVVLLTQRLHEGHVLMLRRRELHLIQ